MDNVRSVKARSTCLRRLKTSKSLYNWGKGTTITSPGGRS